MRANRARGRHRATRVNVTARVTVWRPIVTRSCAGSLCRALSSDLPVRFGLTDSWRRVPPASLHRALPISTECFAGFAPELIVKLVHAALDSNLGAAREAQKVVDPLARVIYSFGEPSSEAHQRMKYARWLMGKFPSPLVRRPLRPLPPEKVELMRIQLESIGFTCRKERTPASQEMAIA